MFGDLSKKIHQEALQLFPVAALFYEKGLVPKGCAIQELKDISRESEFKTPTKLVLDLSPISENSNSQKDFWYFANVYLEASQEIIDYYTVIRVLLDNKDLTKQQAWLLRQKADTLYPSKTYTDEELELAKMKQ